MNIGDYIARRSYDFVYGKDGYCFPTCLKIILSYYGLKYEIGEIAKHLSIIEIQDAKTDEEIGAKVSPGDFTALLDNLCTNLKGEYIPVSFIQEDIFPELIQNLIVENCHIICGYSYGALFDQKPKLRIGHTSLIVSANGLTITIMNPGPINAGVLDVDAFKLYYSMKVRSGGLWVIREKMQFTSASVISR